MRCAQSGNDAPAGDGCLALTGAGPVPGSASGWWVSPQVSLAKVSVCVPVCSRRAAAAAADGARPMT